MKAATWFNLGLAVAMVVGGLMVAWTAASPQYVEGYVAIRGAGCDWCGVRKDCPSTIHYEPIPGGEVYIYNCTSGVHIECKKQGDGTACENNENTPCGTDGGQEGCAQYPGGDYNKC